MPTESVRDATESDSIADELSLELCTACNHPRAFHRAEGGSCFGELNENRASRSDSQSIDERKVLGLECWCPRFETTLASGVNSVLLHGDAVALITSTNAALQRGYYANAEQLLDRYVRKVPKAERDSEWIVVTGRAIARLQSQPSSPTNLPPASNAGPPFHWEELDQRIYRHKRNELANEMQRRIADAERRIAFETSQKRNIGAYWPELLAFHEKLVDEWAQRLYEAHRETWVLQGRTVTPDFIRAVRDRPIAQLLAARRSSVIGQMSNWHRRTGQTFNSALANSWAIAIDRMAAQWRGKLEAEAAASEYSARRPSSEHTKIAPSAPASWARLSALFKALREEEIGADPGNRDDRWLRAHVEYETPNLKLGNWQLAGGITEAFKAQFVVYAMGAALAFRPQYPDGHLLHIWLHRVFQDLLGSKSALLLGANESGGIISSICEGSVLCCLRLQAQTLGTIPHSAPKDITRHQSGAAVHSRSGPAPLRPADFVSFAGKLWTELKGRSMRLDDGQLLKIASRLDEKKYVPPSAYLEGNVAKELKAFNSKNANSKSGPIMSWTRLVQFGDKDQMRGMRRMLSRCASRIK